MKLRALLLFFAVLASVRGQSGIYDGKIDKVTNMLTVAGFTSERHQVYTQDNYILMAHKIFPKVVKERKGPVLLVHGLFGTSADYVLTGPEVALAYLLSNDGYDVWMGSVRGSKHSSRHKFFHPESYDFWQFSFHEMGMFDLPALIDYILMKTGKPSLFFVGHNQATTALLVMLSTRPEYNPKIIHAHLMAPIAFMDYPHPLLNIRRLAGLGQVMMSESFSFLSMVDYTSLILKTYCPDKSLRSLSFCTDLWFLLFGRNFNRTEIDPTMLLDIPKYISPTASSKQWNHYLQIIQTGNFSPYFDQQNQQPQYDPYGQYDQYANMQPLVANYKLNQVTAGLYLYHASEDLVVSRLDVEHLKTTLPSVREYRIIPNWNHMDFVYSKNARFVLYNNILLAMNKEPLEFIQYVKNIFG